MARTNPMFVAFEAAGLPKWGGTTPSNFVPLTPESPTGFGLSDKWGVRPVESIESVQARYNPQPDLGAFDPTQGPFAPQGGGPMGSPSGGAWGSVNRWDGHIQRAISQVARETGMSIPGNVVKAIMMIESQGNPNALSPQGYYGLMQVGPASAVPAYMKNRGWLSDPYNQIYAGVYQLTEKYRAAQRYFGRPPRWDEVAGFYFGWTATGTDAHGTTTSAYMQRFNQYMNQLGAAPGFGGSTAPGGTGAGPAAVTGNSFVQEALKFQGVAYRWGAIPGRGQNPWTTGWDCSGLTYWMDQTYGAGSLPMGSHYQYDYAVRTGQLFTNLSQLQPGDLVFIDTGFRGGGGAHLNPASHVGIYIGNGMMLHASNPSTGTIVSPLSGYSRILGGLHMSWSGGSAGTAPGLGRNQPLAPTGSPSDTRSRIISYFTGR